MSAAARPMSAAASARPMSAVDWRATPNIYQQMSEPAKKITKVYFHHYEDYSITCCSYYLNVARCAYESMGRTNYISQYYLGQGGYISPWIFIVGLFVCQ